MKSYNIPMQSAVKDLPEYARKDSKEEQKKPEGVAELQAKVKKSFFAL